MEVVDQRRGNERDFFFQAEGGIRDSVASRGLGDVYKRQLDTHAGSRGHDDDLRQG